jgi:adenosine deaminase
MKFAARPFPVLNPIFSSALAESAPPAKKAGRWLLLAIVAASLMPCAWPQTAALPEPPASPQKSPANHPRKKQTPDEHAKGGKKTSSGEKGAQASEKETPSERKAARYFESVRSQPLLLHSFLQEMPKGGDLHNHLSGDVYAESLIRWAAQDGLCLDVDALFLLPPPCEPALKKPPASAALQDPVLYNRVLDAFSMRQFRPGAESGHDHFFATFNKFGAATARHSTEMIAEARSRAAAGHLQYMEIMFNPDHGAAARLGSQTEWNDDLGKMRDQLLSGGLPQMLAQTAKSLDEIEQQVAGQLHCGQPQALPGCAVQVRYLYQVSRGLPKERVFAQILAGFELAAKDPRVVGLNLVMPEDLYLSLHDFNLHMRMLDFLHPLYPRVHIALHAGELTEKLVPPEDLFHVRASVEFGHAERIGHGVDVMREPAPEALLSMMAGKKILVEICLTSNDMILNVSGPGHPLPVYLKHGVPVALATDDPGVARGDITQEYQRAAETYHLGYLDLKRFARASLQYSFLPGEGLWKDSNQYVRAPACGSDNPASAKISASCSRLLESSEKARQQWKLEKAFAQFESAVSGQQPAVSSQ